MTVADGLVGREHADVRRWENSAADSFATGGSLEKILVEKSMRGPEPPVVVQSEQRWLACTAHAACRVNPTWFYSSTGRRYVFSVPGNGTGVSPAWNMYSQKSMGSGSASFLVGVVCTA